MALDKSNGLSQKQKYKFVVRRKWKILSLLTLPIRSQLVAVGDFKSAYVDNDDKLKELVLNNFESVFAEDVIYLQNIQ